MGWIVLIALVGILIYYLTNNVKRTGLIESSVGQMYDCQEQSTHLNEEIARASLLLKTGHIAEFDKEMIKIQSKMNEIDKKLGIASKQLEDAENILPLVASVLSKSR